ncbi:MULTISPECIES: YciI family protein [unclassified Microbacterium]|uniref:YciI family protein n=1 Tax=unclassified Microbacterium TaxID=2609290 RepID=UPI0036479B8C
MSQYIIYFNQQWVGEHSDEWFAERGALCNAVVSDMRDSGVLVFAGGVHEDMDAAFTADASSGTPVIAQGQFAPKEQYIGGLTIIDVADDDAAKLWAGRIALACGWPQEVRQVS